MTGRSKFSGYYTIGHKGCIQHYSRCKCAALIYQAFEYTCKLRQLQSFIWFSPCCFAAFFLFRSYMFVLYHLLWKTAGFVWWAVSVDTTGHKFLFQVFWCLFVSVLHHSLHMWQTDSATVGFTFPKICCTEVSMEHYIYFVFFFILYN